jgi:hypothetical protein
MADHRTPTVPLWRKVYAAIRAFTLTGVLAIMTGALIVAAVISFLHDAVNFLALCVLYGGLLLEVFLFIWHRLE